MHTKQQSRIAEVESRRWEGNIALLRRAYAKVDGDRLKTISIFHLHEVIALCRERKWAESELYHVQSPEFAVPLIMHVVRFFEQALKSGDLPKEGFILPDEIVYHQVCWPPRLRSIARCTPEPS